MSRVAVLQSNYIPWKGYFHLIKEVDFFVFYDDVQFTKNDWRNRNIIKTPQGLKWISIPVGKSIKRLHSEVKTNDSTWQRSHYDQILAAYNLSPYFSFYKDFLFEVYCRRKWTNLSELNQYLIKHISTEFLNLKTKFLDSRDYKLNGHKQDRLLDLLQQLDAKFYLSGPSAQAYLDQQEFKARNIELAYINYNNYPIYEQLYPPFTHSVSILDLLMMKGPGASKFIWG